MAAYFSVLQPGDRILGMNLAHGGHLTHGMALNFSGKLYEVSAYGVRQDTERIDYDELEATAKDARPKLIVAGASAYPRLWDFERMAAIAHGIGALLFVDMAHIAGLVAAGVHPSPFPHADIVTTTTHKTLRGPRGGLIFGRRELPDGVDPADFPALKGPLGAAIDKTVFPGVQGGPLMHVIAGKAVAFKLAAEEPFREAQRRTVANAAVLAADARRPGRPGRQRRHGQPPDARRRDPARGDRQGSRAPARRDRHHRQQERHPVRPAAAQHGLGHPPGHAGHHVPWLRRGRDARGRADHHRGHHRPRRRKPSSDGWPARSPTSSIASRSRGCQPREDTRRCTFIEEVGASVGPIVAVFVAAALLAVVLTPIVRRIVLRYRIVDRPNARRVNTRPIPRAGGLAIAASFLVVAGGFVLLNAHCRLGADAAHPRTVRTSSRCSSAVQPQRHSVASTTCSTCAPAGSWPARSGSGCSRSRSASGSPSSTIRSATT